MFGYSPLFLKMINLHWKIIYKLYFSVFMKNEQGNLFVLLCKHRILALENGKFY